MGKSSTSSARDEEEDSSEGEEAKALEGREASSGGEGDTRGVSKDDSRDNRGMTGDKGGGEDVEVDAGEETIGTDAEGRPSVGETRGESASD